MENAMLRNKWGTGLVLSMIVAHAMGQADIENFKANKSPDTESSSFRINDLVDKDKATKSQENSKPSIPSQASTLTRPPPLPASLESSRLANPGQLDMNSAYFEPAMPEKPMDLVGIYYARDVQKAEIIIGGIAHYYATGELLRNNWVLKNIEPSYIELQRCKDKSKRCEFKTLAFTASVRD